MCVRSFKPSRATRDELASELRKLLNATRLILFSNKSVVCTLSLVASEVPSMSGKYSESCRRHSFVSSRVESSRARRKDLAHVFSDEGFRSEVGFAALMPQGVVVVEIALARLLDPVDLM